MLTRCETCEKLYPAHHGECRACKAKANAPAVEKPKLGFQSALKKEPEPEPEPEKPSAPLSAMDALKAKYKMKPATDTDIEQNQLEAQNIPQSSRKKEEMGLWDPQSGGLCASCNTYNNNNVSFCTICGYMLLRSNTAIEITTSYPLKEIKGLVSTFIEKLADMKIKTTADVLRLCFSKKNRAALIPKIGMSERSLLRLTYAADLCRIPDLNPEKVAMLELIGVSTMQLLMQHDAEKLYSKIQKDKMVINNQGIILLPTKGQIITWLQQARDLEPVKIEV